MNVYFAELFWICLPTRGTLLVSFVSGYSRLDSTRSETESNDGTIPLRINVEPSTLEPSESYSQRIQRVEKVTLRKRQHYE